MITLYYTRLSNKYDVHIPIADSLYDQHLAQLRREGLIDG